MKPKIQHVEYLGLPISIEWPKGSVRAGRSATGDAWYRKMGAHYGYIRGTEGTDGDQLDVYLVDPAIESPESVFVVDQMKPPNFVEFDEQKIVLGAKDIEQARKVYLQHYPDDGFLGGIKAVPTDRFLSVVEDRQMRGKKVASPMDYCLAHMKQAAVLGSVGRFLSRSPMRTALVGSGVGAATGGVQGAASAAQDPNATTGQKVVGGVLGAVRGGLAGAAVGGAVGGAGRAYRDTRLLNPSLTGGKAVGATVRRAGEGVLNFGRRQLHGAFGAYKGREGQIGLQSKDWATKRRELLRARVKDELQHASSPDSRRKILQQYRQDSSSVIRQGIEGQRDIGAGITSLPGLAKGLAGENRGETLRRLWKRQAGKGWKGVAMGAGMPALMYGPDVMAGDESDTGGRSLGRKLVGAGVGTGAMFLTGGLPILPQSLAWAGLEGAANIGSKRE